MRKQGKCPLMQAEKVSDFTKLLVKNYGYIFDHQSGSHMIYKHHQTGQTLSIKNDRDISDGTKRNLVKLVLGETYYAKIA